MMNQENEQSGSLANDETLVKEDKDFLKKLK